MVLGESVTVVVWPPGNSRRNYINSLTNSAPRQLDDQDDSRSADNPPIRFRTATCQVVNETLSDHYKSVINAFSGNELTALGKRGEGLGISRATSLKAISLIVSMLPFCGLSVCLFVCLSRSCIVIKRDKIEDIDKAAVVMSQFITLALPSRILGILNGTIQCNAYSTWFYCSCGS